MQRAQDEADTLEAAERDAIEYDFFLKLADSEDEYLWTKKELRRAVFPYM
jgi:hypothetical protein